MLRRTARVAGSYILNQRVVPDWWHPYRREDGHTSAKEVLAEAFRRHEATAHTEAAEVGRTASQRHAAPPSVSDPAAAPLSLYEVNALVSTFASSHDVGGLSSTLQYLREVLHEDLAPFHYHALFRVFNHALDRDNAVQLLEVMAQRGETTQETYARAIDCIASLAPADGLQRILEVVHTAQAAFGGLTYVEGGGSEGATVAAYGTGPERAAAVEEPHAWPGSQPSTAAPTDDRESDAPSAGPVAVSSPVLTSLLHYVAVAAAGEADPVGALLVALWIRAMGVSVSDWDSVHLLTCLLTHVEHYPRVRALLGTFSMFPVGHVSPGAVLARLEARGELTPGYAVAALSLPPVVSAPASSAAATGESAGPHRPLDRLAAAMCHSLLEAGVDMDRAVHVGLVNSRCASLSSTLQMVLRHETTGAAEGGKGAGFGAGLGPHGYNAALLYHTLSIVQSSLRDHTEAAQMLVRAAESEALAAAAAQASDSVLSADSEDPRSGEAFTVGFQYVMDVGSLLPRLSMRVREDLRETFTQLVQRMSLQGSEGQLQATLLESTPAVASAGAVVGCAVTPPLLPGPSDRIGVESYGLGFMRTPSEAAQALRRAVSRVDVTRPRLPREVRLAFKQLAQYCADHPLPNPKLTPTGLAERRKWGSYLDARDTALSLFGSAKQARDAMKHLYYHNGQLPALRSDAVVAQDFTDTIRVLLSEANGSPTGTAPLPTMEEFTAHRTTQPHIRCAPHAVPPYLYDPAVYNPYPHVMLRRAPVAAADAAATPGETSADDQEDFFAALWRTLINPSVMGSDVWYLRNTDMYLLLMRCLLHRLDWEAAAHLTAKMLEHSSYTYLMDHELTTIFREIGDPAGCLAFKVATKLFDGRITRDGQPKRERFHQEQFS